MIEPSVKSRIIDSKGVEEGGAYINHPKQLLPYGENVVVGETRILGIDLFKELLDREYSPVCVDMIVCRNVTRAERGDPRCVGRARL